MKRKALLTFTLVGLLAVAFANTQDWPGKMRRLGASFREYLVIEKTGASTQEMIAGITGQNIVIRNIIGNMTAASKIYWGYQLDSSPADGLTKILPVWDMAAKEAFPYPLKTKIVLPVGEGLDCWTSADPAEGWFGIEYDVVNYSNATGNATY
jgi:hypothetical protein